ncbi:50S ribosomal protein L1 [Gemmata sp. JC673]|uniref:Large ribosomal subunit protein uL1 n=2 Tax=Gemmata algarum TaxID=2975278 RepID=A0ABU5EVY5_9BACT|nr:50S ribosomal protein L1 [Gemmata algarum]
MADATVIPVNERKEIMANENEPVAAGAEANSAATAAPSADAPTPAPSEGAEKKVAEAELPQAKKNKKPGVAPRRGKKLRNHLNNVKKKLEDAGSISVKQAVAELKKLKRAKFDETVELHINLGIDPTQSDQMVRGAIPLPHGIGKSVRVAVFCSGDDVAKAKAAGADVVGGADLVEKVQKENFLEFDVVLAAQAMMGQVSRLGKVLGPRGLMPTPKAGTVVPATGDLAQVVREFKAGKVEYRTDKTGQIHAGVGKLSFDEQKLVENITTFVEQIRSVKPSGVKGNFINGVVLSATMSPGIRLSI